MSSAFQVKDLSFSYSDDKKLVLKNLSCEIQKGKFTCIVGPNGCGKSTLVKLLASILQPTNGTIKKCFDHIAIVFQNPDNQFVSNIVEEDVAFGPENLCFPSEKIREIVDKSLKSVDMYVERGRAISSLSGGEKQRVAIAGALALCSGCIILDEPASMLNSEAARSIASYIQKVQQENETTIICVTQNPEIILLADNILVMDSGKIVADVTPTEFVDNYETYKKCAVELPESVKLIRLLNQKGMNLKYIGTSPEQVVEAIEKLC